MKNRLHVLRAERRWTQAELAQRLGVSRQTINAVETEKYEPSLLLAFRMAAIFETTIESIFDSRSVNNPAEQRGPANIGGQPSEIKSASDGP